MLVFSVTGGIGCVSICYIAPVIAYYKVAKERDFELWASVALGAVLAVVGLIAAVHPMLVQFLPKD